jgi:hypothetical protein
MTTKPQPIDWESILEKELKNPRFNDDRDLYLKAEVLDTYEKGLNGQDTISFEMKL